MIRVNTTEFDESAVVNEMQYHTAESETEAKNKACETLIIGELLKQRAGKLGLDQASEDNKDSYLESLLEKEVNMPEASVEACRQYFESNPRKFMTSPLIEAKHILLAVPPEDAHARSEVLEQAEALIKQLQENPGQFAALASVYSGCPSKETGGSLGQLGKGQTVPEFERQLFNCAEGLAQSPIESRYGVHVVFIAHREEGRPLPFEMVQQRIADYLNEKVRRKAIAQYIETLISNAEIDGFDFSVSDSPLMQ